MEQRLKERLTGAAILVALVVLIVPELFHGHIGDRASKAAGNSEGPPLRSYTIDLGGTRAAPMQLSPAAPRPAPPGDSASSAATTPVPGSAAVPDIAPALPPAPEPLAERAGTQGAPSRQQVTHAPAARTAATQTQAAHTVTHTAATHTASAHPTVEHTSAAHSTAARASASAAPVSQWSVQLGLFAQRANAERMVHTAQAKGFDASLSEPDAKGRYHVHVAGVTTRSAALTLVARLHAAGIPAAAVGPK